MGSVQSSILGDSTGLAGRVLYRSSDYLLPYHKAETRVARGGRYLSLKRRATRATTLHDSANHVLYLANYKTSQLL